ncbi:uncharacterized protein LOC127834581 [Dreissena polymorpha]|uniref:Uncharacterized protein n=1 Tax=Dreissena polymorpha TaxID=45954 RepID=A0A9D4GAV6_DREPO|nr:uncharacterized protein LOC127834581 [Dreissena polymorpha]KAH3812021.1 hypothetical protein DPMN_140442 [Dreissena polymorpha]
MIGKPLIRFFSQLFWRRSRMDSWWYFVIGAGLVIMMTFSCCVWCHCHERQNEILVRRRSCVMVYPETSWDTDRIVDHDFLDGVDNPEGSPYDRSYPVGTGNPPGPLHDESYPYGRDIPGGSLYDPQRTLQNHATAISERVQQHHDGREDIFDGACSHPPYYPPEKLEGATCSQYYQPTESQRGLRQSRRGSPRSNFHRRGSRGQRRKPQGQCDTSANSGSQSDRPPQGQQGQLPVPAGHYAMTIEEDVQREKY